MATVLDSGSRKTGGDDDDGPHIMPHYVSVEIVGCLKKRYDALYHARSPPRAHAILECRCELTVGSRYIDASNGG